MILTNKLKRQTRNVKNKVQDKVAVSPSRVFADMGAKIFYGVNVAFQEATLKTIHQMPRVPYQLWTTPYFDDDPRTPSEFWEWWNS